MPASEQDEISDDTSLQRGQPPASLGTIQTTAPSKKSSRDFTSGDSNNGGDSVENSFRGDKKSGEATVGTSSNQGDDDKDEIGDNPLRPTELVKLFDAAFESFGCKYMESKDQGDSDVYIELLRVYGEVCCPEPSSSRAGPSTFGNIHDAIETAIQTRPNQFRNWIHFFEIEPGPRVENVSTIAA